MTTYRLQDFRITHHARERMEKRGMTLAVLRLCIEQPSVTYASHKFPNQVRCVYGDYVVTLDLTRRTIPTIFFHGRLDTETYNEEHAS